MKVFILDWIDNGGEWASGLVIRSLSPIVEPVDVTWIPVDRSNPNALKWGTESRTTYQVSGGMILPLPSVCGSLRIIGSDAISVAASTVRIDKVPFSPPIRQAKILAEALPQFLPSQVREWTASPWWTSRPMNDARYSRAIQQAAIQFAAMQVYYEFPYKNDRALGVYDASPLSGDPPGHPANSHSANHSLGLDVAYYTVGKNHTQGPGAEMIWSGTNLNNNFDVARNARFFEIVKRYLPEAIIMVDKRIVQKPGMPQTILQSDDPELFNHHLHAHIHLGNKVDFWAAI